MVPIRRRLVRLAHGGLTTVSVNRPARSPGAASRTVPATSRPARPTLTGRHHAAATRSPASHSWSAAESGQSLDAYNEGKTGFILDILSEAEAWAERAGWVIPPSQTF
jgi:hypothetical protein